jgi:acetoacetyl-CoA synthetase
MNANRKKLWEPSEKWIKEANVTRFIEFVNKEFNHNIKNANELYKWSVESIEEFWAAMWDFGNIISSKNYDKVIEDLKFFPGTVWFPGTKLNFAENLLKYNDSQFAFIFQGENKKTEIISYQNLNKQVARLAKSLRELGVKVRDRVVSYIPNLIETPTAMLAATAIGAVWASCGAELQASAVIDRFSQIEPKVLFTVDGYYYRDRVFDIRENLKTVVDAIPSIEKVVVVSYVSDNKVDISSVPKAVNWEDFISKDEDPPLEFEQLPFDHPVYIMFSSGTTGKPKCMVQGAGGILINHLKELILSTDLKRSDVINYITAPSWMMV